MKNLTIVAAAACLILAGGVGKAYAHPGHGGGYGHHNPPPHHHGGDDDAAGLLLITALLESITLTELTEETQYAQKVAIINASPDAAAVLNHEPATDLFQNGKATAEEVMKLKFESDEQAAEAILELTELFSR